MSHAAIVDRIHHGRSTVVLGGMPELPETISVVRVRCTLPGALAPLERACVRIERLLDGYRPSRHHLDDTTARPTAQRFVHACNRLAAQAPGHAVLALDGIDKADPATHRLIAQLLREPARLRLPLLLVVRDDPPETFRAIVDALERPAPFSRAGAAPRRDPHDAVMRRVLRAAAVSGDSFSAGTVARLLGLSADDVLEALQRARDAGVAVRDLGDDRFALPPNLAKMLAASLLPSLRARWSEKLGTAGTPAVPKSTGLEERLDGIARSVRAGDMKKAGEELGSVLDAIVALPPGPNTSLLAARALLERARVRWLGAGVDATFTLDGALEAALEARTALGDAAPPSVRADVAAVVAGIAYDLGDGASIERANEVLREAIAALMNAGATNEATTLLNEQAALELRIGRGRKARELAERSLTLLTARVEEAPTDAAARADLAATHHLLGRIPLHGSIDDATPEAIASALAHVAEAEAAFRALGMRREVGRTLETRARLDAKAGDEAAAHAGFEIALRLADECADLTGLARVTAGLAELLAGAGKPRDALGLLARSIELNREKASPIGLAFDERALAHIEDAIGTMRIPDAELAAELARTRERLARALDLDGAR